MDKTHPQDKKQFDIDEEEKAKAPAQVMEQEESTSGLENHDAKPEWRSMAGVLAAPMAAPLGFDHLRGPMNLAPPSLSKRANAKSKERFQYQDPTNYSAVVPRPLPAAPFRLEPHTHFFVKGSIPRICTVLGKALADRPTDFVFRHEKCKWKVDYYNESQRANLNIVLFKADEGHVIELQRREGDIVSFMKLFKEIQQLCQRNQLLLASRTTIANSPTFSSLVLPQSAIFNTSEISSSAQTMINSKFLDVKLEGIQAVRSLAALPSAVPHLASTVPSLVQLASTPGKARRAAVATLALLTGDAGCRDAVMQSRGWESLVSLASGKQDTCPELQRESFAVLSSLCAAYWRELAQAEDAATLLGLVHGYENIEDARVRKYAAAARVALENAGAFA